MAASTGQVLIVCRCTGVDACGCLAAVSLGAGAGVGESVAASMARLSCVGLWGRAQVQASPPPQGISSKGVGMGEACTRA